MSCVPLEQTFEYGPRDYLNQLVNLISSLRGGQQRYLPLLLTKINESIPQVPAVGYALPDAPETPRLEELYNDTQADGSQRHSSAPTSTESTPFGSPPLHAVGTQAFIFRGMQHSQQSGGFRDEMPAQFANLMASGNSLR